MPSSKPKVYAYFPESLYEKVVQFRKEHQLLSDSQALIVIVSKYFNHSNEAEEQPKEDVVKRLTDVETKLAELASLFNASNVTVRYSVPNSVPSTTLEKGLSQRQLSKRLKCGMETLQKYRGNPDKLLEWSKERDPNGLAWEFKEGSYHPINNE